MTPLLTAAEVRALEARSGEAGVPPALLMERAGAALAEAALAEAAPGGRFLVVCGPGNNGGDGLVAARALLHAGRHVRVELVGDAARLPEDPRRNLQALASLGLTPAPLPRDAGVREGDVVVDALFGTGLSRAPEGALADAVERVRAWRAEGARVVAADLPSGVQGDTGRAFTPAVEADVTVAFGVLKPAHALEPGASHAGRVRRVDIGLAVWPPAEGPLALLEEADARALLPARRADTHKGTYGHVLVVAGSAGKTGAAALAGLGALRGGAGLVSVAARADALPAVLQHAPELMGVPLAGEGPLGPADLEALLAAAEGKDALVLGPGIPRGPGTPRLLDALLQALPVPCVLDADGLNALAEDVGLLARARAPLVLTPHPGEMARLVGADTKSVQADRPGVARAFAGRHRVVLVLKGARTLVAGEDGRLRVNPTGNPGMATGGTGDVLAGLTGALLAQGLAPLDAASVAAYAHGLAGDLAARRTGLAGLVAGELLTGLSEVWTRWQR
jgi:NAD(P)H-hydrate epimerase